MKHKIVLAIFFLLSLSACAKSDLVGKATKIYDGYSIPYDIFNNNADIMTLDKDSFKIPSEEKQFSLVINLNQQDGYIYKYGYYSTKNGWKRYEFPQSTVFGSNWIQNSAAINLDINTDEITLGENYVVSYSCKKYQGSWKCGCSTINGQCNQWMLQTYSYAIAECTPGATETRSCGNCGTHTRTCQSDFKWRAFSQCTGERECSPGTTEEKECGIRGAQSRICSDSCTWGGYSSCEGGLPPIPPQLGIINDTTNFARVCTPQEFDNVRNNLSGNYIQVCDIDLSNYPDWMPIGNLGNPFSGMYDGNNKLISGFTASSANRSIGLFGNNKGIIRNVIMKDVNINAKTGGGAPLVAVNLKEGLVKNSSTSGVIKGYHSVGGLVNVNAGGTIEDSHSSVTITKSSDVDVGLLLSYVGGLVGRNNGAIRNSYATGNIGDKNDGPNGGTFMGGGLVGVLQYSNRDDTPIIENSYATGKISNVLVHGGGLVGYVTPGFDYPTEIKNSYATGDVELAAIQPPDNGGQIGGLIGGNSIGNNDLVISNSYATGNVYSTPGIYGNAIGGLIGFAQSGSRTKMNINNSYAIGNVNAKDAAFVGGLVGFANGNISIFNSYAKGKVIGKSEVGGLAGRFDSSIIKESYATGDVSVARSSNIVRSSCGDCAGGLVGFFGGSGVHTESIENSYATGNVTGDSSFIGGLVGKVWKPSIERIKNSYSTGRVSAAGSSSVVGGLIGGFDGQDVQAISGESPADAVTLNLFGISFANGELTINSTNIILGDRDDVFTVINSLGQNATFRIVSNSIFLINTLYSSQAAASPVISSYWDIETSGQNQSAGGSGNTTIEMKKQSTYVGWDFNDIWQIQETTSYPMLKT